MGEQLLLLVVGFLLTSVLGGALGLFFQTRSWAHQHRAQQDDLQREQALKAFEDVSSLLDRRLYRMQRVFWMATRLARGAGDPDRLDEARADYRAVVATWNDNLNRNLAVVQTYFGGGARQRLEDVIYEEFSAIGRWLEQFVADVGAAAGAEVDVPPIGRRLTRLRREVYDFNVGILQLLQEGRLGRGAPPAVAAARPVAPLLEFGDQGEAVVELQRALAAAGFFTDVVDGSFGVRTEAAVREFQRAAHLDDDGSVTKPTWAALDHAPE